jgi:hypothetical protein
MNRPVGVCITQNLRNPRTSSAYKLYAFYYFYIVVLSVSVSQNFFFKCPNNKKEIYNDKYRHTRSSGISQVLCNANTYRSIHEGLFFNSSLALDLKYPLRPPYIHFYFSSLNLHYKINGIHSYKFVSVLFWWLYVVLRSLVRLVVYFPFLILYDKFLIGIVLRYTILHRIC